MKCTNCGIDDAEVGRVVSSEHRSYGDCFRYLRAKLAEAEKERDEAIRDLVQLQEPAIPTIMALSNIMPPSRTRERVEILVSAAIKRATDAEARLKEELSRVFSAETLSRTVDENEALRKRLAEAEKHASDLAYLSVKLAKALKPMYEATAFIPEWRNSELAANAHIALGEFAKTTINVPPSA